MKTLFFFTFLFLSSYSFGLSLSDLEEVEEETGESSSAIGIEWSGLLDFRFAYNGSDTNWAEPNSTFGGRGLSRYGASISGKGDGLGFHLGQISLVSDILLEDVISAHIQLNFDDHRGDSGEFGSLGFVEAYVEHDLEFGLGIKLGFLIPPVSLEHPNVAWSTKYTITPSAINTWMGEEIRALGIEGRYKLNSFSELTFSVFSHNDSSGTVLAYRGWALHDYQGTYGNRLRWNQVPSVINPGNASWVEPFVEQDDRLGHYEKISFFNDSRNFKLEFFYSDNRADPSAFDGTNYGWRTRFGNASLEYHSDFGLSFLSQYMKGNTKMAPGSVVVEADYEAYYAMLSYFKGKHRVSLRYDNFEVTDEDKAYTTNISDDESSGKAFTFAYLYHWSENKMLGLEALVIDSQRNGNEGYGSSDPSDDLIQLMYRLTF